MKSLSEIETVSKRASRAAGYSWGVAEEVAKNIRLLEIFNLPGIKNLNSFFKKKKELRLENISLINKDNEANKNGYCPTSLAGGTTPRLGPCESLLPLCPQRPASEHT